MHFQIPLKEQMKKSQKGSKKSFALDDEVKFTIKVPVGQKKKKVTFNDKVDIKILPTKMKIPKKVPKVQRVFRKEELENQNPFSMPYIEMTLIF